MYERVSEKVASIDVTNVKESMKGSLQSASATISSYWQDLQVSLWCVDLNVCKSKYYSG
jgi:hypothetical protein